MTSLDTKPLIVVDGVFFQHNQLSGIARVWRALLSEWLKNGFSRHILLLDRAGSAPDLPGLRHRSIEPWDGADTGRDALMLQSICDEEGADLFISSYYTAPISTRSVFLAYDMIPERLEALDDDQIWTEKKLAILHAAAHICISESTRNDLLRFYPSVRPDGAVVIPLSIDPIFKPAEEVDVIAFRGRHGLGKPYFLMVGERRGVRGYKNGAELFKALADWPERHRFELVCVGGAPEIERELRALCPDIRIHHLDLDDAALRLAYAGAAAFVYPSRCEGFGIPLLEAMACACPVVTAPVTSMPEVGGDAPIYFDLGEPGGLRRALETAIAPETRAGAIERGLRRARSFDWGDIAKQYETVLKNLALSPIPGPVADAQLWAAFRQEQARLQARALDPERKGWLSGQSTRRRLFRLRSVLQRHLPSDAMPAARRLWRFLMR